MKTKYPSFLKEIYGKDEADEISRQRQDNKDLYNLKEDVKINSEIIHRWMEEGAIGFERDELKMINDALNGFIVFARMSDAEREKRRAQYQNIIKFDL